MQIDETKTLPKYLQLKKILIQKFEDEAYQEGQSVPTENELIEAYQVSRNTVRKTLDDLSKEGVIYKIQGSGSFFSGNQNQAQQESLLIGVIVPRLSFYIYPKIIQGIDYVAHEEGYNMVLASSDVNPEKELECLDRLLKKNIDGLLIEPCLGDEDFEKSENYRVLKQLEIPLVIMDWIIDDMEMSYVSPNDIEGGYRATRYLIEAGHKRIAIVGPYDTIPGFKRYQGYLRALDFFGLERDPRLEKLMTIRRWNENGQMDLATSHIVELVDELLALGKDRPTAIFFYNDEGSFHGYMAIRRAGLSIPDDVSIIGFDDSEFATLTEVPLTSVIHPKYDLGKWSAEVLFDKLKNNGSSPATQMVFNPTIAVRRSVKKVS